MFKSGIRTVIRENMQTDKETHTQPSSLLVYKYPLLGDGCQGHNLGFSTSALIYGGARLN